MSLFDIPQFDSEDVATTQRNFYRCPCGNEWYDDWDCACDDNCPKCGTTCSPYDSEDIE